jgi:hypothetical protein
MFARWVKDTAAILTESIVRETVFAFNFIEFKDESTLNVMTSLALNVLG